MNAGLSRQAMSNRMNYAIREKVEKRAQEQRRNLMYLVADFLKQQGLFKACESLTEEAQLSNNYQICDNVDLEIILNEYVDYYQARFHKTPQICKQVENSATKDLPSTAKSFNQKENNKLKPTTKRSTDPEESLQDFSGLTVTPLSQKDANLLEPANQVNGLYGGEKVLRPIGNLYPAGSEWREIAEMITREIVTTNLNIRWDDVFGLEDAKQNLKEALIYPAKYPQIFTSVFRPWKGMLLYGPPGTGKTMLAKAVATECNMTFFNITASSLVSKWRGDSEKYVRVLFELANFYGPSIIFIDEIDWIAAGAGASSTDKSEPARRFRADLLSRLDGLTSENDSRIFLLAATNAPWNLDSALLRRLENHIYVDVPNASVREKIVRMYTATQLRLDEEFPRFIQETEGYSSADLKRLCRTAWMQQMGPLWDQLEKGKLSETNMIEKASSIEKMEYLWSAYRDIVCTEKTLRKKFLDWSRNERVILPPPPP